MDRPMGSFEEMRQRQEEVKCLRCFFHRYSSVVNVLIVAQAQQGHEYWIYWSLVVAWQQSYSLFSNIATYEPLKLVTASFSLIRCQFDGRTSRTGYNGSTETVVIQYFCRSYVVFSSNTFTKSNFVIPFFIIWFMSCENNSLFDVL